MRAALGAQPQPFTAPQPQRVAGLQPVVFGIVAARDPHRTTMHDQLGAACYLHRNGFAIADFKADTRGNFSHDALAKIRFVTTILGVARVYAKRSIFTSM